MLRVIILLTAALLTITTQAQEIITCSHACQFNGPDKQGRIYAYESDRDAEIALNKIMEYTGLPTNFELKATNVANAAAALQGNKRYIFYNQSFMQRISKRLIIKNISFIISLLCKESVKALVLTGLHIQF